MEDKELMKLTKKELVVRYKNMRCRRDELITVIEGLKEEHLKELQKVDRSRQHELNQHAEELKTAKQYLAKENKILMGFFEYVTRNN